MNIPFTKMHGLGNDFIVIDGRKRKLPEMAKATKLLCDRRLGVGADQLLLLEPSKKADVQMQIYNADGSQVEMCGNGIRCVAQYVSNHGSGEQEVRVETIAGVQTVRILGDGQIQVNMGRAILKGEEIPVKLKGRIINHPLRIHGIEYRMTCVSMGNPHCVLFIDNLKEYPVHEKGPLIENYYLFPNRTNVEFVKVISKKKIEMRVWERGAGETLACGSGACAAAVASHLNGKTERKVEVKLPGGTLEIEWNRAEDSVYMTGPATTVFEGKIEL